MSTNALVLFCNIPLPHKMCINKMYIKSYKDWRYLSSNIYIYICESWLNRKQKNKKKLYFSSFIFETVDNKNDKIIVNWQPNWPLLNLTTYICMG